MELLKKFPPDLAVTAKGRVPSEGYSVPELIRVVYLVPPEDGIQDYFFLAASPDPGFPKVPKEVQASNVWVNFEKHAPWLKGVRIHGSGRPLEKSF